MHASASLSEDTCCWVYFTECKVHQLPSRLPKIFHCKLLSSREHGYKYKYTKVMLLDFPPPPRPEAKGTWVAIFLGQHTKMGLLGDAENYQRRRKQVHELLLVLVWKLLSVPPHPLARASCRGHHVHLCLMRESTCSNPGAFHTQNGKNVSRGSFLGKKPLLDWDFFSQALQFHSRESCKCF